MAKNTKKRYTDTRRVGTDLAYLSQWRGHRRGVDEEPDHDEVEVVETEAIQDGERVKISVYKDQVSEYQRVLEDAEAQAEEEEETGK